MINKRISIIAIGDELLIGQVKDTNTSWLIRLLASDACEVNHTRIIRDNQSDIVKALTDISGDSGIIIVTGGLGPTEDDRTKATLAEHLQLKMSFNKQQWEHIKQTYAGREHKISALHKHQSILPEGVSLLDNPEGTAMGISYRNERNAFILLPGVPSEMKAIMLRGGGRDLIHKWTAGPSIIHKTFATIGKSETWIAQKVKEIAEAKPPEMEIAFLPSASQVKVRLTYRDNKSTALEEMEAFAERLRNQLTEVIYAEEDIGIEEVIARLLKEKNKQLVTAESCTGGYLAHLLTSHPGASAYYKGSVIAYSNELKEQLLQVKSTSIQQYGAVSEQVVQEMAMNACRILNADYAIALSGIAGPSGGTEEKPVGTIWIAVADRKGKYRTERLNLTHNRSKNIILSSSLSLKLLRKFLLA